MIALIAIVWVQIKTKYWKSKFGEQQSIVVKLALQASICVALALGLMMIFLDPGDRGHLLTIFGIVASIGIALASTPFLSNAMAGIMLTMGASFRPGDYLAIGEHFGRVTKRRLFYLQIQTPDRDLQTLPNLYVVSNPHKVIKEDGTFISCSVSLGYDVSHQEVEQAMLTAALAAQLEEPFMEVVKLGDFSVTYRVAGLLTDVRYLISEKSNLRRLVIDSLHSANIEIVSPTFMNQRQISEAKIKSESATQPARRSRPEDLIFDEAEKVARLERLNDKHSKLKKELATLKDSKKNDEGSAHQIQIEILRKQKFLKILERIIEKKAQGGND